MSAARVSLYALLAGATNIFYSSDRCSLTISLSGKGSDTSSTVYGEETNPTRIDRFSVETCIPLGQTEDLEATDGRWPHPRRSLPRPLQEFVETLSDLVEHGVHWRTFALATS